MENHKQCTKCGQSKLLNEFAVRSSRPSGRVSCCRMCLKAYREQPNIKEKYKIKQKTYLENHKEEKSNYDKNLNKDPEARAKRSELGRAQYERNKSDILARNKNYRERPDIKKKLFENRLKKLNEQYKNDLDFKLRVVLRARLRRLLKEGPKVGSAVSDLGCTTQEALLYIESKFEPGMTWENWSKFGWHLDHIVPLVSFDLTDREQFLKANHYTNLQPLWAHDNLVKGARLDWTPFEEE